MKDIAEIRKLPLPERLQLVGETWDSIIEDPSLLPVSDELVRDLRARLAAHRAEPSGAQDWDIVDHEVFAADDAVCAAFCERFRQPTPVQP